MKLFISVILIYFYIFGVQTHYSINEKYFKNFKELKDRRGNESVPTSTDFSSTDVFCNDLSACAQNSKKCFMQNTSESLMAQNKPLQNGTDQSISLWFLDLYFHYLPTSRSSNDAFVKASVDHFNVYQSFKFSSYNQFKTFVYGTAN